MKYKNSIVSISIGVCIIILFYLQFSKPETIVYVNNALINQKYQGMIDGREKLQQRAKAWQANIDTLTSEYQNEIMQYEKNRSKMTANEIILHEQLINSKREQLLQYTDAVKKRTDEEQGQILEEIYKGMNMFIEKYAKGKHYRLVLGSDIIYGSPDMDITESVIEGLNNEYKIAQSRN